MKEYNFCGNVINKCIVRRNRTMPFIYKTTNIVNNKIYIGKANKDDPLYLGSGLKIKSAIKKYSKSNFHKEIIEECESSVIGLREKYWIEFYNSTDDNIGYNISSGGEGGNHYWSTLTAEERIAHNLKISESKKGKSRGPHSNETRQKIKLNQPTNPEWLEMRAEKKRKWFTVIDHTTETVHTTKNLKEFCQSNQLCYNNMLYNAKTKKNKYAGRWSCRAGTIEGTKEEIIKIVEEKLQIEQDRIKSIVGKNSKKGNKNPMFNKKHTEKSKDKIRRSRKKYNEAS